MLFRRDGQSIVVHTPAKLNLFLEILAQRADGFHELETLMVSVDIYDTLSFTEEESAEIRLRCFNAGTRQAAVSPADALPAGRENIVVQAAELLRNSAGIERGVRIGLTKRIPSAAGLAGGSSNAAATLIALNRLWKLELSAGELFQLAAQLGSDVGFFLAATPAAICRGRGEEVEPLEMPFSLHFVIAKPASGLSTAVVYRHCRPAVVPRHVNDLADALKRGRFGRAANQLHNALQPPAFDLNDDVKRLADAFSELSVLGHQMSGSGTAYFGMCNNRRQALRAAAELRNRGVGRVFVAQCRP